MFGLSKRRVKLGRFKLSDSPQAIRSPMRHSNNISNMNGGETISSEVKGQYSSEASDEKSGPSGNSDNWITLSISGDKPVPCFNHAATVIGSKMVVVGGESDNSVLEDVQVLDFDTFSWTKASSKLFLSPSNLPLKIPASVGHSLVSWGQKAVMVGGKTQPSNDRVSVWVFDVEVNGWSLMEAKGDIPIGRTGHSLVRAGSVLILFGGEDLKKKKLNDLYMFDLKSLTWLPLHCTGPVPSPRSEHVAAIYDDRVLLVFGGSSKSKTFNDLYSLDFEAMTWSRIKTRGFCPSPRSGCSGVLCGTKWYIVGGGCRNKRHAETLVFDVLKVEWNVAVVSPSSSLTTGKAGGYKNISMEVGLRIVGKGLTPHYPTNYWIKIRVGNLYHFHHGFSLVLVRDNDKDFLVIFGGCKKDPSNEVEIFQVEKKGLSVPEEALISMPSENNTSKESDSYPHVLGQHRLSDLVTRKNLASEIIKHGSGRRSLSESFHVPQNIVVENSSAQKQLCGKEHRCTPTLMKNIDGRFSSLRLSRVVESGGVDLLSPSKPTVGDLHARINNPDECRTQSLGRMDLGFGGEVASGCIENDIYSSCTSTIYEFCESRVASLIRDNGMLEGKLVATVASREAMEKNLSSALGIRQEVEKKLADNLKETEFLKEKMASMEVAQEETNNLSSIVHSDNIRLEHDVAFLKAVLDDTQKELHSTRGVLAGERARAFQLQVEVFHLKQRMQNLETRTPTPRKPFPV